MTKNRLRAVFAWRGSNVYILSYVVFIESSCSFYYVFHYAIFSIISVKWMCLYCPSNYKYLNTIPNEKKNENSIFENSLHQILFYMCIWKFIIVSNCLYRKYLIFIYHFKILTILVMLAENTIMSYSLHGIRLNIFVALGFCEVDSV